jgi:hypothetical protein
MEGLAGALGRYLGGPLIDCILSKLRFGSRSDQKKTEPDH